MTMPKPSAFIVRRARLVLGMTRVGFAEKYKVDDSTISQWERGVLEPSPAVLAKMHTIASVVHAPSYSPDLIRATPVFKFLAPMDRLTQPVLISRGVATSLAEKVGLTPEELINHPEALNDYYNRHPEHYSHSISRALHIVQEDSRWLKLEISYVELRGYGRIVGVWGRGLVAPVPDDGLALFEAVRDRDQSSDELWVKPTLVHGQDP
jgi:transcriptional regulator with XRE-family HTH domain